MKIATIPSVRVEPEFVARGLASLADARRSGEYVDAGEMVHRLKARLESAKAVRATDAPSFPF
ncbi:hypothetical protein DBV14_00450 [Variovorax sp. KBW07]|uniref:hypothetical protein n=1 Tax=Variovorax sp. KBW07 TaxID=2153358 RepID=UPI000F55C8A4|nr:hypothetical protein [Variovorax sp. KBW07]RQO64447.1 hypothetical protein DBV14_00450 [Variovorax sp. KBW07]